MASAPTLSALEEIFRKNMNQRSLEFGGISVALCGDPAQLPPIMNKVIYMPDQRSISGLRGFKLYCNMARLIYEVYLHLIEYLAYACHLYYPVLYQVGLILIQKTQ